MLKITAPSQVEFKKLISPKELIYKFSLKIPAGLEINEPIILKLDAFKTDITCDLSIEIGANAHATIIEDFDQNHTGVDFTYHVKINAEKYSYLRLITLQNLSDKTGYLEFRESFVLEGAEVNFVNCQFGARSSRTSIIQNGIGVSPTLNTDFISSVRSNQSVICTVKNHFYQKNGSGEINAKGVARDKSSLEINGVIAIDQLASGTSTYMHEDALLLSDYATVKATPSLEINTNDVKASHGASISNLSDDVIFYAQSRGIEADEAKSMLAKGFLSDRLYVIKDLPILKERVSDLI